MMIEDFTGMIGTLPDASRRAGRVPAVVPDWAGVSVRPRPASVGVERLRSLSRARARAGLRTAVPDDGSAVGGRVLPGVLLPAVRRSPVDSAARPGRVERGDAGAAVHVGEAMDRRGDR